MPRARRTVTVMPQPRALARYQIAQWITQGSVTRYKEVPADSEQAFNDCQWHSNPCPSHLRRLFSVLTVDGCGHERMRSVRGGVWESIPYIPPHPHLSCLHHVHLCTYVPFSSVVVRT